MKSLSEQILDFLIEQRGWVNGGEIERLSIARGYKASNGSRRCREMAEEGLIIREERTGDRARSVWYRVNDERVVVV